MNHTPMSDEEFSLRMDMYNSACVQIAALKEQNRDMLKVLIEVYSAWRHTDNVTDPDADGYEILNKIKSVIERATGRKIEEAI